MKGLELCERFYLECGEPMLKEKFSDVLPYLAIGLAGSGSECLGYDDDVSRDHDFEAGFCIFLPDESIVDRKTEFALERAYSKLPKEFMGFERSLLGPVGGNRHGVIRMAEFFKEKTGDEKGNLSVRDWFYLPDQSLLEATGGRIFRDDLGRFSKIRRSLSYFPEDVRLKKLAGQLLVMGQSGQYNYQRCVKRGESGAAQLAVIEFVKAAMSASFLLDKRYMPYYKWSFRALSESKNAKLASLCVPFEYLISSANTPDDTDEKQRAVEEICAVIVAELKKCGLSEARGIELERHAYSVNDNISDPTVRNLHILFAV